MSLMKFDPIPPGVYWLDLQRSDADDVGNVSKERTLEALQQFRWWAKSFVPPVVQVLKADGAWVLFRVDEPAMRWGAEAGLGFPTVAQWGEATTRSQVVQRPDPEGIAEFWLREGLELLSKTADNARDAGFSLPSFEGIGTLLILIAVAKAMEGRKS